MKKKFIIIGLAMGSLGFSQGVLMDSISIDSVEFKPRTPIFTLDTIPMIKTTKICGRNTSKNLPCKNKTTHESGCCHYHRED